MNEYKFVKSEGGVTVYPPDDKKVGFREFIRTLSEVYGRPVHSFFYHHHYVKVKFDYEVVDPRPVGYFPFGPQIVSPLFFSDTWEEYLFSVSSYLKVKREKVVGDYMVAVLYPTEIKWILPYPLPPIALLLEMDPTTTEPRTISQLGVLSVGLTSRYYEIETRRISPAALLLLSRLFVSYVLNGYLQIPVSSLGGREEAIPEEEEIVWGWVNAILTSNILKEERIILYRKVLDLLGEGWMRRAPREVPSPLPVSRVSEILYNEKVSLNFASNFGLTKET